MKIASRAAALALLLLVVAAFGLPAWQRVADDRATLQTQAEKLARYRALATEVPDLRHRLAALGDQRPAADLLLPGASEAQAAAALQERLKGLLAGSGAVLISLQPLPARTLGAYRQLGLRLQFTADTRGLQQALYAVEAGRPLLTVDTLYVRVRGTKGAGASDPLDVTLDVSGFRAGGGS